MWQVVPSDAYNLKCPAVPVVSALVSSHVPFLVLLPELAAFIQSLGKLTVDKTVPESAAAQLAGAEPVNILRTALVPIAVSIASNLAFRTVVDNCIAIIISPHIEVNRLL